MVTVMPLKIIFIWNLETVKNVVKSDAKTVLIFLEHPNLNLSHPKLGVAKKSRNGILIIFVKLELGNKIKIKYNSQNLRIILFIP
jgi:hypothetical protein